MSFKSFLFPSKKSSNDSRDLKLHTIQGGPLKGYQMHLNLNAAPWQKEMLEGVFDKFIFDELETINTLKSEVIWDIGAHVGYHTLCFAAIAGQMGKVVSFEPNIYNFKRLSMNCSANAELAKTITLVDKALSDANGEAAFVFNEKIDTGESSGSGLETAFQYSYEINIENAPKTKVAMLTADSYIEANPDLAPTLMKIDVEGAEFNVLSGAATILQKYRPLLVIEVHNITAMFYVQKHLSNINYDTKLLNETQSSSSRCHIIAYPL